MDLTKSKNTFLYLCEHAAECDGEGLPLKRSKSHPGFFGSTSGRCTGSDGNDHERDMQVEEARNGVASTNDAGEDRCHIFEIQTHDSLPPFSETCIAFDSEHAHPVLGASPLHAKACIQPDDPLKPYSNPSLCKTQADTDTPSALSDQPTTTSLHKLPHKTASSADVNVSDVAGLKCLSTKPVLEHPSLQPAGSLQLSSKHSLSNAKAAPGKPAAKSMDQRTTVMLRNLPPSSTISMIMRKIDAAGFRGKYDFVYLPMDFKTPTCPGFCFVNLTDPAHVSPFWTYFEGYSAWQGSKNKCSVTWSSKLQGLEANIKRYKNSPVMHESVPDGYKPRVFRDGVQISFPPPTRKIKVDHKADDKVVMLKPLTAVELLAALEEPGFAGTVEEGRKTKNKKASRRETSGTAMGTMSVAKEVVDESLRARGKTC
eukprot:TRINITY_DN3389_c1_g1_i2.p1 TRINITY_DN3389_c1_g1~~TRINITY_DN3389_c1_g1_i2.p1  ORF type:complete len:457 (+),score=42.71 TRINITY_DN3389_c1_g1_i2:93-1373(+)